MNQTYPADAAQQIAQAAFVGIGQLASNVQSQVQSVRLLTSRIHDKFFGSRPPAPQADRPELKAIRDGYVGELRSSLEDSLTLLHATLEDLEGMARELGLNEAVRPGR